MASALCRTSASVFRRSCLITCVRNSACGSPDNPIDQHKGKVASDKVSMPDTIGHAVGPERFELLAKLAGSEDPFEMNVKKMAKGTKDEPTMIPSLFNKRLVGCICEEDAISINWMYLYKGEPKRCECGYWFKLQELKAKDYTPN